MGKKGQKVGFSWPGSKKNMLTNIAKGPLDQFRMAAVMSDILYENTLDMQARGGCL